MVTDVYPRKHDVDGIRTKEHFKFIFEGNLRGGINWSPVKRRSGVFTALVPDLSLHIISKDGSIMFPEIVAVFFLRGLSAHVNTASAL